MKSVSATWLLLRAKAPCLGRYFELLSGAAGNRDWEAFRGLFLPEARLDAIGVDEQGANQLYPQTLDEFVRHVDEYVREQAYFHEPVRRSVQTQGRLGWARVFFESRNRMGGPPIDSGTKSFHLLRDGGEWRIAHVMWQSIPTPTR